MKNTIKEFLEYTALGALIFGAIIGLVVLMATYPILAIVFLSILCTYLLGCLIQENHPNLFKNLRTWWRSRRKNNRFANEFVGPGRTNISEKSIGSEYEEHRTGHLVPITDKGYPKPKSSNMTGEYPINTDQEYPVQGKADATIIHHSPEAYKLIYETKAETDMISAMNVLGFDKFSLLAQKVMLKNITRSED